MVTPGSAGFARTQVFTFATGAEKFLLDNGETLGPVRLTYETFGRLNRDRSNAVLITHGFSGDAHAAGVDLLSGSVGWWDQMIGPGKAFDTNRFFVICSNVLGSCKGSTGPCSINPATGEPYGLDFPRLSIKDMVNAQKRLVDHLGIPRLFCVAGGSMGGMQALQWVVSYPEMVRSAVPIASTSRHSPQQIAFNEVARQAITSDQSWNGGRYHGSKGPENGLAVARMLGHITYMSDSSMSVRFGRARKEDRDPFKFTAEFEVEGYLKHRGASFVKRFDANAFLYLSKAMDGFDLSAGAPLEKAFAGVKTRLLVVAYRSDWLYPPRHSKDVVRACKLAGVDAAYCEIDSEYGHDAFLVETDALAGLVGSFLDRLLYETTFQKVEDGQTHGDGARGDSQNGEGWRERFGRWLRRRNVAGTAGA